MMKILITGGASGLGKSITKTLAVKYPDAQITFTYFSAEAATAEITAACKNTVAMPVNFRSEESVGSLCTHIAADKPDVLINNALTQLPINHFHKTPHGTFGESFETNVLPVLAVTRAFLRAARNRKSGRIVTILSAFVNGMPQTGLSGYIAEKRYLLSMAMSWAAENAAFNIQSNCISPEFMDTPLNSNVNAETKQGMMDAHPLKQLLKPEDAAEVVTFLVTAPAHLNGQNIFLNAGKN